MPHDANARRQAAAVPLVLFGDHGRTVEGYMPAEEDLAIAQPASSDGCRRHVRGPHLRPVRTNYAKNKTGIVGISLSYSAAKRRHYLYVNLGDTHRKFCIETIGNREAWRRAISLRKAHLEKLALANAAIIAARLQAVAERRAS